MAQWIKRLCDNISPVPLRTQYARALLAMLDAGTAASMHAITMPLWIYTVGHITAPFDQSPPSGPLPPWHSTSPAAPSLGDGFVLDVFVICDQD